MAGRSILSTTASPLVNAMGLVATNPGACCAKTTSSKRTSGPLSPSWFNFRLARDPGTITQGPLKS